jgi:uncharacterized protein DUF5681
MSDQDSAEGKPKSAVGYGRPPVNRQFKPGQSGNPKGRPKGQKNFATIFGETLHQKILVRDKNGKTRWLTKQQAMCEVMTNKAVNGDAKAFTAVFQLADKHGALEYQPPGMSVSKDLERRLKELSQSMGRLAPQPATEPDTLQEAQNDAPTSDSAKEK